MKLHLMNKLVVFEAVARLGSFTRAAEELSLTKGTVSQHIATLEEQMGLRLLARTSRKLALTAEGRRLLPSCTQIVEAGRDSLELAQSERVRPRGLVRVTTSHNLAIQYLSEAMIRFRALHPEIQVELAIRERWVELAEEGIDLALRIGELPASNLIARRVGGFSMIVCAAPAYLARRPPIRAPEDLEGLDWVAITSTNPSASITLEEESGLTRSLTLTPGTATNSGICALTTILKGGGIGLLPDYGAKSALESGALVNPLPRWRERQGPISLVWAPLAKRKLRVETLIDFLVEDFRGWSKA